VIFLSKIISLFIRISLGLMFRRHRLLLGELMCYEVVIWRFVILISMWIVFCEHGMLYYLLHCYLPYSIGQLEPYTPQQPSAMIRVLPGLQNSSRMVQSRAPAILTLVLLEVTQLSPFLQLTVDQHGFLQQDPVRPVDPHFPGFINCISAAAADQVPGCSKACPDS
jgi:hypothetical protein